MATASGIIGAMSDVLKQEGWIQNQTKSEEGVCMVGAFQEVMSTMHIEVGNRAASIAALNAIHDKIQEDWGYTHRDTAQVMLNMGGDFTLGFTPIPNYNDTIGRTKDEVLTLLDKARIGLEERGL
jgi:hypothetical protein